MSDSLRKFLLLFLSALLAQEAWACAPVITATAVSSKPYSKAKPVKPKIKQVLWRDDMALLVSVIELGPCAPAMPIDPSFSVEQKTIFLAWKWNVLDYKTQCIRQVNLTVYIPKGSYKVAIAERREGSSNCAQ